ncbi:MAG: ATP synthase F0 subunit C [Gemmataceae bacterium]
MKTLRIVALALMAAFVVASSAFAADSPSSAVLAGSGFGAGIGAALTIIGAGFGFGKIGAAALESMARQPEVAGRIQTAMIVIAALLEGATFFALIVCIQVAGKQGF